MSARGYKCSNGFSLIELIVVIVILSILAVFGAQFVVSTTQNYEQTRTRALLVNTGRQALEQMTRQLRGALPYSVRVINGGNCLEFMPIAGGGIYLNAVPDEANSAAASPLIAVAEHQEEFGDARWVSIGAMAANEIYGPGASLRALAARSSTTLTLGTSARWQRNSINRRFYLLDNPQAFCVQAGNLNFYSNLNIAAPVFNNPVLMAQNVSATTPFDLTAGSENRNTIVVIDLDFTSGGETVNFRQQVMIRNVP